MEDYIDETTRTIDQCLAFLRGAYQFNQEKKYWWPWIEIKRLNYNMVLLSRISVFLRLSESHLLDALELWKQSKEKS